MDGVLGSSSNLYFKGVTVINLNLLKRDFVHRFSPRGRQSNLIFITKKSVTTSVVSYQSPIF